MSKIPLDEPTVIIDGPDSEGELEVSSGGTTPSGSGAVHKGMKAEEAARARTIGQVFFLVCLLTLLWAPHLDGHPELKVPVVLVCGVFSLTSLYVSWLASVPERYTRKVFLV